MVGEVGEREAGRDGHGDGVRFAAAEHEGNDWGEPCDVYINEI